MKYINLSICLITAIMLTALSCKKTITKDPLPPATQTGANIMGCYINGKPWLPDTRDNGSIPRLPEISISKHSDSVINFAFYKVRKGDNQRIQIYLTNFSGLGNYIMNKESDIRGLPSQIFGYYENYGVYIDYNLNKIFSTSSKAVGSITITYFDEIKKIISGTFNFKAKLPNELDSLIISDGRFDCKFN